MSELYFLPTPNWFISRPLDIYNDETNVDNPQNGIVALSVIGSIYFIDYKFKSFYNCIKLAHLKRINALSFKKSKLEGKHVKQTTTCEIYENLKYVSI